jgi:hypothetical protein
MKTLKCDLCEVTAEGETFEDWMQALMPHYKEAHAEVMKTTGELPKDEQDAHRAKWMTENKARFESDTE